MESVVLLLSDNRGVYIPENFIKECYRFRPVIEEDPVGWAGADEADLSTLEEGPEAEGYWDAWDAILNDAFYTDSNGHRYHLHQEGDLFAYCPEKMDCEEQSNLFGPWSGQEMEDCLDGLED